MKTIITISIGAILILIGLFSFTANNLDEHNARCTGSANCNACSNCSRCGHCSAGGSCGVCRGSSSGRSFYSSGNSSRSGSTSGKKKNTNSSHNKPTNANSVYGFYSGSSINKKKTPVYYYNGNSNLSENNFLFVNANTINIRKGPGKEHPIIEKATKNQQLVFLLEEDDWLKIAVYNTGTEGYVYKKLVRK